MKDFVPLQIDESDTDRRSYRSEQSGHERAHPERNRDQAYSVGTAMDCIDEQNTDLLPLLLNEANGRGRCDGSGIERRLNRRSAASLRGEIEPHDVLVAL